jgi:hypothetical protein
MLVELADASDFHALSRGFAELPGGESMQFLFIFILVNCAHNHESSGGYEDGESQECIAESGGLRLLESEQS